MRLLSPGLCLCLAGCWLTPAEIEAARSRIERPPSPAACDQTELKLSERSIVDLDDDGWDLAECGVDGGLDAAFTFSAPITACYRFAAEGSTPSIAVYTACPEPGEADACNAYVNEAQSNAYLPLLLGDKVHTVVEARDAEMIEVRVTQLDTVPMLNDQASGNTQVSDDQAFAELACGRQGVATNSQWTRWTSTAAGSYRATLSGESEGDFDGLLSVHPYCTPQTELECSSEAAGSESLTFEAEADTVFLFRIASFEGFTGNWTLTVEPL